MLKAVRYGFPFACPARLKIDMYCGAKFLQIEKLGGKVFIYVLVDVEREIRPKEFLVVDTNEPIDETILTYIGSVSHQWEWAHIFML